MIYQGKDVFKNTKMADGLDDDTRSYLKNML